MEQRIVIVGPADLVGTAAAAALQAAGLAVQHLGVDGGLARDELARGDAGLLLVDIDVPGVAAAVGAGVEEGWQVLVLGGEDNKARAAAALAAGADAWLPKSARFADLLEAIRAMSAGAPGMLPAERSSLVASHWAAHSRVVELRERLEQLSGREREVFQRLVSGQRPTDVSVELYVSIATVRTHIQGILRKLGVSSQQQAVELHREVMGWMRPVSRARELE